MDGLVLLPPSPLALAGPTGESNTWTLRPRGRVACIAAAAAERDAQAALVRALGNVAVDSLDPLPDAVLFAGSNEDATRLRVALAECGGPIVPVIEGKAGRYDALRLVVERTRTVNTTASGGNASLLSLADDEHT